MAQVSNTVMGTAEVAVGSTSSNRLVTIVVIGYNQQVFIERALTSVLSQDHRYLECIFVDDGSKDSTFQIASEMAIKDERLKVIHQNNAGPSAARRHGASLASLNSQYIGFLDGDDTYFSDFVTQCLEYLDQHADVGAVVPGFVYIDADDAPLPTSPRTRWAPSRFGLPALIPVDDPETPFVTFYCGSAGVPFWLAPLSIYRLTEGWDVNLWPFEDTDMLAQLALQSKVHTLPAALVGYRVHPQQTSKKGSQRSGQWKEHSLEIMHVKWNNKNVDDQKLNTMINNACIYYRRSHLPLRSIYVAKMAFSELLAAPSMRKLRWLCFLLIKSTIDFAHFRIFFWRAWRSWNPEQRIG